MDRITKHARLTGPVAVAFGQAVKREYERGESIRAIAAASGRSYHAVHRALQQAGVRVRSRGGQLGNANQSHGQQNRGNQQRVESRKRSNENRAAGGS